MNVGFSWSDELRTDIVEIDNQHRALIKQFNELINACGKDQGAAEVERFLTFLTGYVQIHFGDEEKVMQEHGYPGLASHQKEHTAFREKLDDIKRSLAEPAGKAQAVAEAVWLAAEWFVRHIRQTDLAMAAALRAMRPRPHPGGAR